MQSKATTVEAYLKELAPESQKVMQAVRETIVKSMDPKLEEGMQYGMIGYYVPHSVYPSGYHCDPRQPLPFACLASQKNYFALYLMPIYMNPSALAWFQSEWKKTGKKLDMGKSCIRFKKLEDISLDLIAQTFRKLRVDPYIEIMEQTLATRSKGGASQSKSAKGSSKSTKVASAKSSSKAKPVKQTAKKSLATKAASKKKAAKKAASKVTKKESSKKTSKTVTSPSPSSIKKVTKKVAKSAGRVAKKANVSSKNRATSPSKSK